MLEDLLSATGQYRDKMNDLEQLMTSQRDADPEGKTQGLSVEQIRQASQVWKQFQADTFHMGERWRARPGHEIGGRHGNPGGTHRDVYFRMNQARKGSRFRERMEQEGKAFYAAKAATEAEARSE